MKLEQAKARAKTANKVLDILVELINTLSLTELVSDALASRKQKEAETNAKIVDLFKDALDEIKNSWCTETLCQEVVQLLVQDILASTRSRTRMQLLWTKSHGARLYAHQSDLLDRRPVCSHSINRDSGSRHEGCRDCDEGATKVQT